MNRRSAVLKLAGMLLAVTLASAIGTYIVKWSAKQKNAAMEAKLMEGFKFAADQINARVPKMIDSDTRLDKASVGPGLRLTYHYTLPNRKSDEIDADLMLSILEPDVVDKACHNADMKSTLQYGGIYTYVYSGKDGVQILTFDVEKEDCGPSGVASE